MDGQDKRTILITITEAAHLAPGRPSTNCVWRWCRKGVKSRAGERVRLEHRRIGGKIFTTLAWLEEFGRQLAAADSKYFELRDAGAAAEPAPGRKRLSISEERHRQEIAELEQELEEAGL